MTTAGTAEGRVERIRQKRLALPDAPGVYLFKDQRGKVIYVGKATSIRKRVAGHFSKPSTRGALEMTHSRRRVRLPGHRDRGRGAADRAELHQAPPAALQRPAARRQVLPVHRGVDGGGLPAGVLHPREAPPWPRLLRPVLERQARARDAGAAGQGVPVPHLPGRRARAPVRKPVPGLLHQALPGAVRGLRVQGGVPAQHRDDRRLPLRPLPAAGEGAGAGHARRRRRTRSSRPPPSCATS